MVWTIKFEDAALKDLRSLDRTVSQRIVRFLEDRVVPLDDPRTIGEPLQGPKLGEFWKYRVGDHRIMARIYDTDFVIVAVRIGHRRAVYR